MMHPSDPSWRQNGYLYADIPAAVQGHIRAQLKVLGVHAAILLPGPRDSVLELLSYPLPPISSQSLAAYEAEILIGHSFFSPEKDAGDATLLMRIPVPPPAFVVKLVELSKQQWLDGAESLSLPNEKMLLPLWAISFWTEIHIAVVPAQSSWHKAIDWLRRDELLPFYDDVEMTLIELGTLAWSGAIDGFPKSTLLPFLSRQWLGGEQIDQMLAVLQDEITAAFPGRDIRIIDTIMTDAIVKAYVSQKGTEPYIPAFLHRFGQSLVGSSEFAGIYHINGNHWIGALLDLVREVLGYGDPAGGDSEPDKAVVDGLHWFISKYLPESMERLDTHLMESSKQELLFDSWQCGLFSFNMLGHCYLPESYPLLGVEHVLGDTGRLEILRKIIVRFNHNNLPIERALPPATYSLHSDSKDGKVASTPHRSVNVRVKKLLSPSKKAMTKKKGAKAVTVIAPIFQVTKAKKARAKKVQLDPLIESDDTATNLPSDVESDGPAGTGCPRCDIMDFLTVEVKSDLVGPTRQYRCAGKGCRKIWHPRCRSRVLLHCKRCLKMSIEQRQLASTSSAETSPGALVAAASAASISTIATSVTNDRNAFFGVRGRKQTSDLLNFAIVKLVCVARIPPSVVDLPEWKELLAIGTPSYQPASRTTLMDDHIMSEQERVRNLMIEDLKTQTHLTCTFDGGTTRGGDAFYTVRATTHDRRVMLLDGQECTKVAHTGLWISKYVLPIMIMIGIARWCALSSDNTGNTCLARQLICEAIKTLLNFPDPAHHLNNMILNLVQLPYFQETIKCLRGTIKFFSHSNAGKAALKDLRIKHNLGPGLESIGKTRFGTIVWSAISLRRSLPAIRELVTAGKIEIKNWNHMYNSNQPATLSFEMKLIQLITITEGPAKAIECLEAVETTPADVYLYWLAVTAHTKRALETCGLPDDVCAEVRGIVNTRWREFFVDGPSNAHLAAFYLNPGYLKSSIFKRPNALTFGIILPARGPTRVPPGIDNPKTFREIGAYLLTLAIAEIMHGIDPVFTVWKKKKISFMKKYKAQFTAYAQGCYPFVTPFGEGDRPIDWWRTFLGKDDSAILASLAVKLYSAVPHSMADERTMSVVTMMNTALRNRQKVETIMALTQIRGYYRGAERKARVHAHPRPEIKFCNIKRILRGIDDDKDGNSDRDESDDELDKQLGSKASTDSSIPPEKVSVIPPDDVLVMDNEREEVDILSVALEDLLATEPIKRSDSKATAPASTAAMDVDDEEGDFDIGEWV